MKPERTEPIPMKAGDKRVMVNGEPVQVDFRIISEELYQELSQSSPVESKWVSVKERTPEFDGRYLCFIEAPQECGNIWRFQEVVDLHFNEWITSEDQYVTHWKPLGPNP